MKALNLAGVRFGRLVAQDRAVRNGRPSWRCTCDCGGTTVASVSDLRSGNTESCGCLRRERISARKTAHGMSETRTYTTWINMRQRCKSKREPTWSTYGARGITVCERWESFEAFYADMGDCPDGMSIDRIDNDRGYEPGNCRWATATTQCRNRRNTVLIQTDSGPVPVVELAQGTGIPSTTFRRHVARYGLDATLSQAHRRKNLNRSHDV